MHMIQAYVSLQDGALMDGDHQINQAVGKSLER